MKHLRFGFFTILAISNIFSESLNISKSYKSESNNDLFENKNILILGGTGYLGRALTIEILKYNPKKISLHL